MNDGQAKTIPMLSSKLLRYAVVISLLILSTFFVYNNYKTTNSITDDGMITYIEKVNPTGQKSTTTLSDGTVVKLNSDSKLKFPKNFSDDIREVYFEGEAFFDVAKDASRPFIIKTNDLQVKVLGTSFNVKSFEEDNLVQIGVVTGRVSVQLISGSEGQLPEPTILLPEQSVVYNSSLFLKKNNLFKVTFCILFSAHCKTDS
ncbi:MAG: transmembrane sensor [Cyclobacteriaceae bacterium]